MIGTKTATGMISGMPDEGLEVPISQGSRFIGAIRSGVQEETLEICGVSFTQGKAFSQTLEGFKRIGARTLGLAGLGKCSRSPQACLRPGEVFSHTRSTGLGGSCKSVGKGRQASAI
jgi:hypothetical protein